MNQETKKPPYWLDTIESKTGFKIPVLRFKPCDKNISTGQWTVEELVDLLDATISFDHISDIYISTGKNIILKMSFMDASGKSIDGNIICLKDGCMLNDLSKNLLDNLWIKLGVKISDITNLKKRVSSRASISTSNSDEAKFFRVEALNYTSRSEPNGYAVCLRPLVDARPYSDLDVHPLIFKNLFEVTDGMHLTLGKTGSGKSTTLSSLLEQIIINTPKSLVSLEKPIEYIIGSAPSKLGCVFQFDTNENVVSFSEGADSFLRFNPDLCFFGELKAKDEIETSLELSTAGKAVFATAHTTRVWNVYTRLVKKLPKETKDSSLLDLISEIHTINAQLIIPGLKKPKIVINEFIAIDETDRENLSEIMSDCINSNKGIAYFTKKFKEFFAEEEKKGLAISFEKHLKQRLDALQISQSCYDNTLEKLNKTTAWEK